ncbi:MAG: GntR family transcriptional regulator [Firmicutes bacterium]|nr:GntR family transcriptional regulator [Bacillota bacterium]
MLQVDIKSSKPIYKQIMDQIKEGVVKGVFQPGDKLPSVRELSTMLTINPNTVSKAYQELEREGAIETRRGRGTFIVENYKPQADPDRLGQLNDLLKKVVVEAYYLGLSKKELKQMLADLYAKLGGARL